MSDRPAPRLAKRTFTTVNTLLQHDKTRFALDQARATPHSTDETKNSAKPYTTTPRLSAIMVAPANPTECAEPCFATESQNIRNSSVQHR